MRLHGWRNKVFPFLLGLLLFRLSVLSPDLCAQEAARPEETSLQAIKILIFDEKWEEALQRLDEFLQRYPSSPLVPQALFFRARCLSRLRGREEEALRAYQNYLRGDRVSPSLVEEAELAIIELAADLFSRGRRDFSREIEARLESPNRVIRYYAAFKLSYFQEKNLAAKSIPVLQEIIRKEQDIELKDRARIALLRVSPASLREVEESASVKKPLGLKLLVEKKGKKEPEISITIPWSLADLALNAIPAREKEKMRKQGYDIDRILQDLTRNRGQIIEIREEDTVIKIWIE